VEKLKNNEILILPTDTIYGLSMKVQGNQPIVLNSLKKADWEKPIIILIPNLKSMKHLIDFSQAPEGVKYLKDKTAPTTVVFKSKQNPNETIAVRICKRKDIKKVLKKSGPIYSTSVNFAGEPPLTKKPELTKFLGKPKNVYWVGPLNSKPSKIYDAINHIWIREW